ncbi:MAG: BlaI/MecI/CopY family transcriptional regulator [Planctomycetes bacterium]|nr:BlaI/MecI/CopY family transcriptional regulator [Planctomycetota bacterium]
MPVHAPGRLELALLEVLWRDGPATAQQARERLHGRKKPTSSTVLTVLRRMEAKGWLTREKVSRSHVYLAAVDRDSIRRRTLKDLLARLFDDSPEELVAQLVSDRRLTAKELERIEALLATRREAPAKNRS